MGMNSGISHNVTKTESSYSSAKPRKRDDKTMTTNP